MARFTSAEDERLVENVGDHPALYDTHHKLYKDQIVRENVWLDISEKVGRSVEDCKKRWKNIKDHYHRQKKSQKLEAGSPTNSRPSKWSLFNHLSFLDGGSERCSLSNISNEMEAYMQNLEGEENEIETKYPNYVELSSVHNVPVDSSKSRKRKHNENDKMLEIMEKLAAKEKNNWQESLLNRQETEEEESVNAFFRSISLAVKKLPPPMIVEAKMEIFKIVANLELRALQFNQGTSHAVDQLWKHGYCDPGTSL